MKIPYIDILKSEAGKHKVDVHLVGGYLRDALMKRTKNDYDFAVSAKSLELAQSFAWKIKGAYVLLDQEHQCARVAKKIKGEIYTFDFAGYRAKTFKGDLAHRDFTVNTFAIKLNDISENASLEECLIKNDAAIGDLKSKIIRMVNSKVFVEDPLRIMRAFSMMATHNFKIEDGTRLQIQKDINLINDVSYERITAELFKILESPQAYKVIKLMNTLNVFDHIIPQVKIMYGCTQGAYHHLDVWKHTLETINQFDKIVDEFSHNKEVSDYLNEKIAGERKRVGLIRLGLLLHDIGKPDTRKKRPEGGYSFYSHEHVGKKITYHVAKLLKISTKERHILEDYVQFHLRPGYISNFKRPSSKMIFRYFRDTKSEAASIALLSLADQRATRGALTTEEDQVHHQKICERLVDDFFSLQKEEPFIPLIKGDDLIKQLKLKPSPLFSKILSYIEEQQALGKIKSKEDALKLAKNLSKKESSL